MNPHYWQSQIEDIADRASKDSGTVWPFALLVISVTPQPLQTLKCFSECYSVGQIMPIMVNS